MEQLEFDFDYDRLGKAVAKVINNQVTAEHVIWNSRQCADYFQVTVKHFNDKISKSADFPNPIKLPSQTGTKRHSRWYANDVYAWAYSQKQKN